MSESGMTIRRNAIPLQRIKESYQMAMTTRRESKTITLTPEREEPVQDLVTQRKRLDSGRFHLQVAVYDGVDGVNKIIELPTGANPRKA
jgi:hypothetical protein